MPELNDVHAGKDQLKGESQASGFVSTEQLLAMSNPHQSIIETPQGQIDDYINEVKPRYLQSATNVLQAAEDIESVPMLNNPKTESMGTLVLYSNQQKLSTQPSAASAVALQPMLSKKLKGNE